MMRSSRVTTMCLKPPAEASRKKAAKSVSAGRTSTSRSITSSAWRTRNMLACSAFGDHMAARDQLDGVDVLARQQPPHADAQRHRDDDRHDDVVVARHLEDHGDRGHRSASAATHHRRHADDGAGDRIDAVHRPDQIDEAAEGCAQRRAHEQRRRENTAGRAGAEADRGCEQLGDEQAEQQAYADQIVFQDRLDGGVADAFHEIVALKPHKRVNQDADHQHADAVAQIRIGL